MLTEIDEGKGLVKTTWSKVRDRVAKVEPQFAAYVDKLSPDKSYPLFLLYCPFGMIRGTSTDNYVPKINGGYYSLSDPNAPDDVKKHLGYGAQGRAPFSLLLDKAMELYMDFPEDNLTIPYLVYTPGSIFPFSVILNKISKRNYGPSTLSLVSGVRSVFLLPNIGDAINHAGLRRDYHVRAEAPKKLYQHWEIFKEISNSTDVKNDWRACVMCFSEKWLDSIDNDPAWAPLSLYLHKLAWKQNLFQRNQFYYDVAFSVIQKSKMMKYNPYLVDTVKHLYSIASGMAPGYAPATDDNYLPLELIQRAYLESYGLKKYYPTIMHPKHFSLEDDNFPIYYSLQYPSTLMFSPKSRNSSSTLVEMREASRVSIKFQQELSKPDNEYFNNILGQIAQCVDFRFFHNKRDTDHTVSLSTEMSKLDSNLCHTAKSQKIKKANFAPDSPFVRGCVSLQSNKHS